MSEAISARETVDVGALEDFPVGSFRVVRLGRQEVGVLRLADDSLHALRNVCPHAGAPLCRGQVGGTMLPSRPGELDFADDVLVIRCPWHAWEFDLKTGEPLYTGTRGRVRVFPVACVDGRVVI